MRWLICDERLAPQFNGILDKKKRFSGNVRERALSSPPSRS